jgi:hypothetical protein
MDERRVQCEFFIPIVRDSDKNLTKSSCGTCSSTRFAAASRQGTAGKVNDLRLLLRMAALSFDQQAIYLSVAGQVEFVMPTDDDGYL